jgi:hypothetical protein
MCYHLFLDESGHDHRHLSYELRGGIAIHIRALWPLICAIRMLETTTFGAPVGATGREMKGHLLLSARRFRWAQSMPSLPSGKRLSLVTAFREKGPHGLPPTRAEFAAYGQASLAFVHGMFALLEQWDASLFMVAIPRGIARHPPSIPFRDPRAHAAIAHTSVDHGLRPDHALLFAQYGQLLARDNERGLVVMDHNDKATDRRFLERMTVHFTTVPDAVHQTARFVPMPFFVASDLTSLVQAADICAYCVNVGYRDTTIGMIAPVRAEVAATFGPWITRLLPEPPLCGLRLVLDPFGIDMQKPRE